MLIAVECNPSGPGHPTVLSSREETQADKHTCRRNSTQTCICSNSVMHTTVFLCHLQHCLPHTASYLKLVWMPASHLFIVLKKGFHFFHLIVIISHERVERQTFSVEFSYGPSVPVLKRNIPTYS